jgi:polyisoprenoid-binding protein YceI
MAAMPNLVMLAEILAVAAIIDLAVANLLHPAFDRVDDRADRPPRIPGTGRTAAADAETTRSASMNQQLTDRVTVRDPDDTTALALPPGRWVADPAGSNISFAVHHFGPFVARGGFERFAATLLTGDTLADVVVSARVDLSSLRTTNARRDERLRAGAFFGAGQPWMAFRSTSVTGMGRQFVMRGDLTIATVTRPVAFDVELTRIDHAADERPARATFRVTGEVRRRDFDSDFGLGAARSVVGGRVKIALDVQFMVAPAVDDVRRSA